MIQFKIHYKHSVLDIQIVIHALYWIKHVQFVYPSAIFNICVILSHRHAIPIQFRLLLINSKVQAKQSDSLLKIKLLLNMALAYVEVILDH